MAEVQSIAEKLRLTSPDLFTESDAPDIATSLRRNRPEL